ncbi:hypothetical protein SDC9_99840 [bioreactor metagenome]|uniref:Uncharacterized protein n=1 Tax=bioreactor metagenome TaxID=1076179 RepID=A0A645AJG3_9ZZZZ
MYPRTPHSPVTDSSYSGSSRGREVVQQRGQSCPAARAPGLDRPGGAAEHGGCLLDGEPLHVHQDQRRALVRGDPTERLGDRVDQRLGRVVPARPGGHPLGVERGGRTSLQVADPVQAGVDHDPVQPGRDAGVAAERVGPAEGPQVGVLQGVRGVLRVAEGPQRHRPEAVLVAPDEHREGLRGARDVGGQQLLVGGRLGRPRHGVTCTS